MMRRFKKPKSTRSTVTFVPNFFERASPTLFPIKSCTAGICSSTIKETYKPTIVHIPPRIIFFRLFKSLQNYYISCDLERKPPKKFHQ